MAIGDGNSDLDYFGNWSFHSELGDKLMSTISPSMISAIQVQFCDIFFEDDFVEKGMKAWLTGIDWSHDNMCYVLYFDFSDFEEHNAKYFRRTYFGNRHTHQIEESSGRTLFTAIEAGRYDPKYMSYFSLTTNTQDDELFEKEIQRYLHVAGERRWNPENN